MIRVVDHDVRFGVSADEGDGDAWSGIREKVLAADVLVLATPIWMGLPSAVCKMVLERLDSEIAETDDQGRPILSGKVAVVAVVGNEDGAHSTGGELFGTLSAIGYTIPAQARPTGSVRRCRAPTTKTWTLRRRRPSARPRPPHATRRTWGGAEVHELPRDLNRRNSGWRASLGHWFNGSDHRSRCALRLHPQG